MTLHFLYWYDLAARRRAWRRCRAEDLRLLRGWTQRDLYGYWTHAGFMNWDTGWSYERWMKGKAWAYGQQGLLAIATSPQFQTRQARGAAGRSTSSTAACGSTSTSATSRAATAVPPERRSCSASASRARRPARCSGRAWAANAARAVSRRHGPDAPPSEPPPFYAYDADIGRLAVSTRHYSTAILAVNRGKVPYGGNELARLTTPTATRSAGRAAARRPPSACASRTRGRRG